MRNLPPNFLPVVQGTAEWLKCRVGQVTASRVADVVLKQKNGKYYKARADYMHELLFETVTGNAADHYVSPAMDYGKEWEDAARDAYAVTQGLEVELIGYVQHPTIKRSGASPDGGLVGDSGLVEIKVPNSMTHFDYLIGGVVPEEYVPQCMWQMACAGVDWVDFASFDPRVPPDFRLFIKRLHRDDKLIAEMECEVVKFLGELEVMCQQLLASRTPAPAAASGVEPIELPAEDWLASQVGVSGDGECR